MDVQSQSLKLLKDKIQRNLLIISEQVGKNYAKIPEPKLKQTICNYSNSRPRLLCQDLFFNEKKSKIVNFQSPSYLVGPNLSQNEVYQSLKLLYAASFSFEKIKNTFKEFNQNISSIYVGNGNMLFEYPPLNLQTNSKEFLHQTQFKFSSIQYTSFTIIVTIEINLILEQKICKEVIKLIQKVTENDFFCLLLLHDNMIQDISGDNRMMRGTDYQKKQIINILQAYILQKPSITNKFIDYKTMFNQVNTLLVQKTEDEFGKKCNQTNKMLFFLVASKAKQPEILGQTISPIFEKDIFFYSYGFSEADRNLLHNLSCYYSGINFYFESPSNFSAQSFHLYEQINKLSFTDRIFWNFYQVLDNTAQLEAVAPVFEYKDIYRGVVGFIGIGVQVNKLFNFKSMTDQNFLCSEKIKKEIIPEYELEYFRGLGNQCFSSSLTPEVQKSLDLAYIINQLNTQCEPISKNYKNYGDPCSQPSLLSYYFIFMGIFLGIIILRSFFAFRKRG